jgi:hypothetical protein
MVEREGLTALQTGQIVLIGRNETVERFAVCPHPTFDQSMQFQRF